MEADRSRVTQMVRYQSPEFSGHNIAFKGKRYWIIEVDEDHPFDWVSVDLGQLAVYDKELGTTIAFASKKRRGGYHCTFAFGQNDVSCDVDSIKDIGRVVTAESWRLYKQMG
jgi:hypothetical protein